MLVLRRVRSHRFALGALLLCVVGAALLAAQLRTSVLQPPEIDRLRLRAGGANDRGALAQLVKAARGGNRDAQRASASVLLARMDQNSVALGLQFAKTAAERGDPAAQYLLARTLFDGNRNLPADRVLARAWLQKAAGQDHPQAAYLLGLIYKNGYGIGANQTAATAWFARAAAHGDADAMFMLATAYLEGAGVKADQAIALRWFQQAAEMEQPLAAQTLAYALRDGTLGLAPDARASAQMMVEVEHALHHPREAL